MTYGDGSPVLRTMWQCVDDGEPVEVYVARDYEGDDLVAGDSYRAGLSVLSEWVNGKYRPQRKNKIKLVVAKRVDADEQA